MESIKEVKEPNPSSTTVMNIGSIQVNARTPAGAAYVRKVTHPPTIVPDTYCGIPDISSPNVVLMEVKGESNFPPVLTSPISVTATSTINPNKMMFLQPSGGKVAAYTFMWNHAPQSGIQPGWQQPFSQALVASSNPTITNICPASANNSGYNWLNWFNDVGQMRTAYKSQTFYLNATNFNNQGTVTTCKFKPNILYGQQTNQLMEKHQGDKQSDANLKQMLRTIPSMYKNVHARQQDDYEILETTTQVGGYPTQYVFQVLEIDNPSAYVAAVPNSAMWTHNGLMVDTPSDVLTMSSRASTRPAKDGSFVVQQPVNSYYEWTTTGDGAANLAPSITFSGPIISIVRTRVGNTFYYFPLYSENFLSSPSSTQLAFTGDAPWNNLDWAITMFDGITVPPTVGTTLTSVPYVTIKSFCGLELQPQFRSSIRPFAKLLPPPDREALDIAATIFHGRPDDLPASANDLASIASTALNFLPTAVGFLKNLFGGKKEHAKAMETATEFVNPKTQAKPDMTNDQFAILNRRLDQMQVSQPSTLPTYTNTSQIPQPQRPPRRQSRNRRKPQQQQKQQPAPQRNSRSRTRK